MRYTISLSYGFCTILPFCIGILYFLMGYGHPNPNFPKMSDDLVWFHFSAMGVFAATLYITAISLPRFQKRMPSIWAYLVWLSAMLALATIILAMLFVGTNARGFLD